MSTATSKAIEWRTYQPPAIEFMRVTPRCNLNAGMGLGKTVMVETLIDRLQFADPVLVIAPLRVCQEVWSHEHQQWDHLKHLRVNLILGQSHEREAALRREAQLHVVNYDNLQWLCARWGHLWPYRMVVCDESTRLKSFRLQQGSKRAQALSHIAWKPEIGVQRWVNMTGTPAPNGLQDLWGPQWFIDGGAALGRSFTSFRNRWFRPVPGAAMTPYRDWVPQPFAKAQITKRLERTTLSIRAEDYFKLEEPVANTVSIHLPPEARKQYRKMLKELSAQLDTGVVTAANAAVKTIKLLQLASGAVYHDDETYSVVHDEKIEALRSIVEESAGEPVLVSYQFRHEWDRIKKAFSFAREIREPGVVAAWNAGQVPLLCAHPASAGHGLNLQHGGRTLVYFSCGWNLEHHEQILERIGPTRQKQSGYNRSVFVHTISAIDTLDETVAQRLRSKVSLMDALMAAFREVEELA